MNRLTVKRGDFLMKIIGKIMDANEAQRIIDFNSNFRDTLHQMSVAALSMSDMEATLVVHTIYSPEDITFASFAAYEAGMTPKQGVASLALNAWRSSAYGGAKLKFLSSLKFAIPPRKGSMNRHRYDMTFNTIKVLKEVQIEQEEQFATVFWQKTADAMGASLT
jgi:hypothetical protein